MRVPGTTVKVKKTCEGCTHYEVCSLKTELELAEKALDEVSYSVKGEGIKLIRDVNFIKPIKIECVYYLKKGRMI